MGRPGTGGGGRTWLSGGFRARCSSSKPNSASGSKSTGFRLSTPTTSTVSLSLSSPSSPSWPAYSFSRHGRSPPFAAAIAPWLAPPASAAPPPAPCRGCFATGWHRAGSGAAAAAGPPPPPSTSMASRPRFSRAAVGAGRSKTGALARASPARTHAASPGTWTQKTGRRSHTAVAPASGSGRSAWSRNLVLSHPAPGAAWKAPT